MSDTQTPPGAPPVGEALKRTQAGKLPIGSVEDILKAAPKDIVEEVVDIPEWGYALKLRSLTAAQSAQVKQRGFAFREGETAVAWAEMEKMQFLMAVREPSFTESQVTDLYLSSGAGFARAIQWIDENSGIDKKALEESRKEFQEQSEQS